MKTKRLNCSVWTGWGWNFRDAGLICSIMHTVCQRHRQLELQHKRTGSWSTRGRLIIYSILHSAQHRVASLSWGTYSHCLDGPSFSPNCRTAAIFPWVPRYSIVSHLLSKRWFITAGSATVEVSPSSWSFLAIFLNTLRIILPGKKWKHNI